MDGRMRYHLLKGKNVDLSLLNSESYLKCLLLKVAKEINATVLNVYSHKFEPQGISVVITIAESHIAVHTFPDCNGILQLEIATCSSKMDAEKGIKFIIDNLGLQNYDYKVVHI